jgi:murein L,D-transpeptidase YafK
LAIYVVACGPAGPPPAERNEDGAKSIAGAALGSPIFIRIFKEEHELEVWTKTAQSFELARTYEICTYSGDLGPKLREGDLQAPEGFYFVTPGQMNPNSRYHLAFNIGYPNAFDRAHGRTGGLIMVHGDCVSIGCFAMTDASIEEIYGFADASLRRGQPFFRVHVFPFRMSAANMERHEDPRWYDFWGNLKEGYDIFERDRVPPNVNVENGRYVFDEPEP